MPDAEKVRVQQAEAEPGKVRVQQGKVPKKFEEDQGAWKSQSPTGDPEEVEVRR